LFPKFASWFPNSLQSRIVAIPNYASIDITSTAPVEIRDKTILAAGRLAKVKNYRALIDAWALLPQHHAEWQVKVFGIGPEQQMLSDTIQECGLQESFHLMGHSDQIGNEYRRAAIFCHPALFEGFGLVAAEALACETPVVAFRDVPGLSEFLQNGINSVLATPGETSAQSLASALDRLITDPRYREQLGKNGPESISHFSPDHYRRNWISLINQVAGITNNG
jgi:glycosyltransferase involved in cell wall biosynthesis